MSTFYKTYPLGSYSVIIEDDGKVAYAYLLRDKEVVGDLWLYNQAETPEAPEWKNPARMPFLNPRGYVDESKMISPITDAETVECEGNSKDEGQLEVTIFIKGSVYGLLRDGCKPGWNVAASKDGPLANTLHETRR